MTRLLPQLLKKKGDIMDEQKRFKARIFGVVQGIGFRWFVRSEAQRRNITGFVRNLPDGSVEVEAQGENKLIEEFIATLRKGPSMAIVSKLEIQWLPPAQYHSFEIKF